MIANNTFLPHFALQLQHTLTTQETDGLFTPLEEKKPQQ